MIIRPIIDRRANSLQKREPFRVCKLTSIDQQEVSCTDTRPLPFICLTTTPTLSACLAVMSKKEGVKLEGDMLQCKQILEALMSKEIAEPFSAPVDWEELELPEYPKIIKNPMDLGTVLENLEEGKYADVEAFGADVRLTFNNAKTFNQPGSQIFLNAESLLKQFDRKFATLSKAPNAKKRKVESRPQTPGTAKKEGKDADAKEVTSEEQFKLIQLVKQLSSDQLGQLVDMVNKRCPAALSEEENDFLEIQLVSLDAETLSQLNAFAEKCVDGTGKKKKA